jgi:outer membrane protein
MSKDLDRIHQKNLQKQKNTVDSIIAILQDPDINKVNDEMQHRFVFENNKLKEMGEYFTKNVSQQVWSRINSYVQEYGALNNYSIIMGTQGNGNIMYAQKDLDITDSFIDFANKKYEGE